MNNLRVLDTFLVDSSLPSNTLELFYLSYGVSSTDPETFSLLDVSQDYAATPKLADTERMTDDIFVMDISKDELSKYNSIYVLYRNTTEGAIKIGFYGLIEEYNLLDEARNLLYLDLRNLVINCNIVTSSKKRILGHYHPLILTEPSTSILGESNTYSHDRIKQLIRNRTLPTDHTHIIGKSILKDDVILSEDSIFISKENQVLGSVLDLDKVTSLLSRKNSTTSAARQSFIKSTLNSSNDYYRL